jgi:hypothetical protein
MTPMAPGVTLGGLPVEPEDRMIGGSDRARSSPAIQRPISGGPVADFLRLMKDFFGELRGSFRWIFPVNK